MSSNHPFIPQPTQGEERPFPWKWVALGCGCGALIALALLAFSCTWFLRAVNEPTGFSMNLAAPPVATVGTDCQLVVHVTNDEAESMKVGDVDIATSYLDAFVVVSVVPEPSERTRMPFPPVQSFTFGTTIPPKETHSFTFTLKPMKAGTWRGDVDVYEGLSSITQLAETVVQ